MLIPLLQNVSMLLAVVVIYALVGGRHSRYLLRGGTQDLAAQFATGLMIGVIAIAMILTPVRYAGLLIDARSILLSLAALFLGPIVALMAMAVTALYRTYVGGPAVLPAIMVMATSVAVGLIWRHVRRPKLDRIRLVELYLFGLAVHLAIIALAYAVPTDMMLAALRTISVTLLAVFPLGEVVIGGLLVRFARQETMAQSIKLSEERYRLLADNVTDIILKHDLDFRIDYVSPAVRQLGYEPEELIGVIRRFSHPDDLELVRARWRDVIEGRPCGSFEARVRRADGAWTWIESNPTAIRDDQGRVVGVLSTWRDVMARKAAESTLQEVQAEMARVARISSLGAFSASLAHEINQPLAALAISSDVAQRLLETTPPDLAKIARSVERSARDARRASEIVARMRALTSRQPALVADFNLSEAIGEMLTLSRGELQRWGVAVEESVGGEPILVHGDRIQIQQVVLNLIQNAIEAMRDWPEGERRLRLSCRLVGSGEVRVEVEDRGPGLDPGSADSIFEHLFTTKQGGTGLGLAISKSIIEAHGGRIWVERAEPHGAAFKFQLPQRAE